MKNKKTFGLYDTDKKKTAENADEYTEEFYDDYQENEEYNIEEAYLYIKDYLRVFCEYAIKLEEDILIPTKFEKICERYKKDVVMLVDAIV